MVEEKVTYRVKFGGGKPDRENLEQKNTMDGRNRSNLAPGREVLIVLKQDQKTGKLTRGIVQNILTSSAFHPRGIKVRLTDGQVGRVQQIVG